LLASFPEFLAVVEQHAPARLAEYARALRSARQDTRAALLNDFWNGTGNLDGTGVKEFPARAFLQPYAEFVRLRCGMQWDGHTHSSCPFCNRKPGLGVLRPLGDGGQRSLICSFCLAEWQFRRILCPACGEENHAKLPVYTAAELQHVRVECCDSCKSYLKTVDLTKNGLAEPVIDEIAAVPLDLWAQEHGYAKLQPNILQM
jgi:FdhE protein